MQSKMKTLFNELNKHVKQINQECTRTKQKCARTRTEKQLKNNLSNKKECKDTMVLFKLGLPISSPAGLHHTS